MTVDQLESLRARLADLSNGVQAIVEVAGHELVIIRTGEVSAFNGRPRFFVACSSCRQLIHEMTADVLARVDAHVAARSRLN